MISEEMVRDRLSVLDIDQSKFTRKDIRNIIINRQAFSRSLLILANLDEIDLNTLNEIDKLIVLLKDIIGLELLVRFNERGPIRDQFSKRIALLLATRTEQLEIIRNHLDVLYRLRNEIAHSFSISKGFEFEQYFRNDLDTAVHFANSYHKLLLTRLFIKETTILDKVSLFQKLEDFEKASSINKSVNLEIPLPKYYSILCKELDEITGVESIYSKHAFNFKLPEEKTEYWLGLNSHGGLITPVHYSIDRCEYFYDNKETFTGDSRKIPSEEVWEEFTSSIKEKAKEIQFLKPKRIRIVSKTHKSILFFTGYHLSKIKNSTLVFDIDGKEIELEPLKDNVNFNNYWSINLKAFKEIETEAVLILNISGHIDQVLENDLKSLNISNLPRIICKIKTEDGNLSPIKQKFYNKKFIKESSKALELFLNNNNKTKSLRKIHLFEKSRGIFILLLGIQLRSLGYEVYHYEYGRRNNLQDKEEFYYVFKSSK